MRLAWVFGANFDVVQGWSMTGNTRPTTVVSSKYVSGRIAAEAVIASDVLADSSRPLPALRGADLVAVEHLIDTDSLAEESLVLTRCLQCINA